MLKDKIIYGNIITLDDKDTIAEAIYVKDGKIAFVGSHAEVQKFKTGNTLVLDYGNNSVYPGFMDSHIHGSLAAVEIFGYINLASGKTLAEYINIMKDYVKKHPEQKTFVGTNWLSQNLNTLPTKKDLDTISTDVQIYLLSEDKHIVCLNSKALEHFNINKETIKQVEVNKVSIGADGEPTGIFTDMASLAIVSSIELPTDVLRRGFIQWQKLAFSLGYTTVLDAAVMEEKQTPLCSRYSELVSTGLWKLRTYAVYLGATNKDIKEQVAKIKSYAEKFNSEYFKISGIKLFQDGIIEAQTAWLSEPYVGQPDNYGDQIIKDQNWLVDITSEANKNGLWMHIHSIGDASTHFVVDAMAKSQKQTGIKEPRNIIAHLELVNKEDMVTMGQNNIIACVAPLWIPFVGSYSEAEEKFIGKERRSKICPIKSFIDAKVKTVFHSDYPGCHSASIQDSIFRAVTRYSAQEGPSSIRGSEEAISRKEALYAMTKNAAYAIREEKRLGTIEVGKIANFTVFDKDFLTCPKEEITKAKVINTIVDGEIVH